MTALTRREFITVSAVAGGMLVGVRLPRAETLDVGDATNAGDSELLAWIRIRPDESVMIAVPSQEIGQGVATAQSMLIADELDADWGKVTTHQAEADKKYGPQGAGGSQTIIQTFKSLRTAGATARAMLIAAAAQRWRVAAGDCTTEPGIVVHAASGRRLSYGAIAADAAKLAPPQKIALKPKEAWRYIGKDMRKRETPAIVAGKQQYGIDLQLPDMLIASIEHTPTPGAKPSYDSSNALKVDGVVKIIELAENPAIQVRGGVVVIARDTWAAFKGRNALAIVWDEPNAMESTEGLAKQLAETVSKPGQEFAKAGDLDAAVKAPNLVTIHAEYEEPFLAHMVMEPQNCVVQVKDGKAKGWGPTQNAQGALSAMAAALKFDVGNVAFQPLAAGGGFGRRGGTDAVAEASLIAVQADGAPVKLVWKREDETRFDTYRPMSRARVEVSADKDGNLVGWYHHLASTLGRPDTRGLGEGLLYEVPNSRFDYMSVKIATKTGPWRGVDYVYNIFAVESAIDELAAALGQDPLALRMRYLSHTAQPKRNVPQPFGREPIAIDYGRMQAVLKACGDAIGWKHKPSAGRGMGVAAYTYAASHCAVAAEVELTDKGALKLLHMAAAMDVGTTVNPLGLKAQIEGGLTMGLSAALRERITVKAGRALQSTYNDYMVIRMQDVPPIDVVLIESGAPPSGGGEIAVPGIAPALANAVYAATGERIRALPLFHAKPTLEPKASA